MKFFFSNDSLEFNYGYVALIGRFEFFKIGKIF